MGRAGQRPADPGRRLLRQPAESLVAAVTTATGGRRRCTPAPAGRAAAPTAPASAPGRGSTTWLPSIPTWPSPVAPHQERGPHPGPSPVRQQPPGVVAVPPGPPVERHRQVPDGRGRLPLLRQPAESAPGTTTWPPATPTWPRSGTRTKNGRLTPRDVVPGSRRKVWWQCPKGHVWQAAIASRAVDGAGCPVCAGKQVAAGENDLATLFPHLAQQWDRARNGALTPGSRLPLQQPEGLVGLRPGPPLAGSRQRPGRGKRLPLLRRPQGPSRGSTTWPPGTQRWPRSGTPPSTAASPPRW